MPSDPAGPPHSGHWLSKSKIQSGLQCQKRLYMEVHSPELMEVSSNAEHRFAVGHDVGEKARALWPAGHLVEYGDAKRMIAETERYLSASPKTVLFEGTFRHDAVLVRADVLVKAGSELTLIEVKSSSKVKDYHIPDCAVQAWVIEQSGYPLSRIELAHIDTSFIYQGDGDYRGLIHREEITGKVRALMPEVRRWIATCRDTLAGGVPSIGIGDHCNDPWPCPFYSHCSKHLRFPEYPLSILPGRAGNSVSETLADEGIEDIREISEGRLENAMLERVRRVTTSGRFELDDEACSTLEQYPWPRYYLDFETVQFVVPLWAGTRPYEQLPFQWSCHVMDTTGYISHEEFLDTTGQPPMRPWIESLLEALGDEGPVFHYHSFEKTILNATAVRYPDLARPIAAIVDRLVDLLPLTRTHYYHPKLRGSWSLKQVIPTIETPGLDLSYEALSEISDGGAAMIGYSEMIHPETSEQRRRELDEALRQYCKLDTLALLVLEAFLRKQRWPLLSTGLHTSRHDTGRSR